MLNPLRSEGEAFRFLLWCAGVIGAVVVAVPGPHAGSAIRTFSVPLAGPRAAQATMSR